MILSLKEVREEKAQVYDRFHFYVISVTAESQHDAMVHLTHVLPALVSLNTYD